VCHSVLRSFALVLDRTTPRHTMRSSLLSSLLVATAIAANIHIPGLPQRRDQLPLLPVEAPEQPASFRGRWFNFWPFNLLPTGDGTSYSRLKIKYDGYVVLRFNISTVEHEAAFREKADQLSLDIWDFGASYTDVLISRRRIPAFLGMLPASMRGEHMILIEDIARAVAATYPAHRDASAFESAMRQKETSTDTKPGGRIVNDLFKHKMDDLFFRDYQPLSVIETWMDYIDTMFKFEHQGLVSKFSIGRSYEGRDIPALRVGSSLARNSNKHKPRKTILITGGLHAREWISVSTVNYLAYMFATNFGRNEVVTGTLEHFDIVFVPVLNPDGYEYTWNVDRLWRKSRQPSMLHYCYGFDLNHSFGYRWDTAEHQSNPCSESYGGKRPFQAVEAEQLAEWAKNETDHNVDFVAYFDLHSYSQQILWPYAYSCDAKVPNLENMQEVAMNIAKYMRLSTGETYTVGSACESAVASDADQTLGINKRRIEAGGGSAIDYFHHDLNARYSFQIKLRDTGSYGFLLPSDSIVPVGDEVFEAVKFLGDYLLGNNGIERGGNMDMDMGMGPASSNTRPDSQKVFTTRPSEGFELRRRV
jgi:extracellular matrix protein 14